MKILKSISLATTMLICFVGFGQEKADSIQKKTPLLRCQSSIESSNDSLIVIDGTTLDYKTLETINPNTIESVDVIKGANATALFGIKGKNGVIIIKTKKLSRRDIRKLKKQSKQEIKN